MFFFFNDTATTEIYTLSLHDALPIFAPRGTHRPLERRGRGPHECRRHAHHVARPSHLRASPALPRRHRDRRSEEHTSELQSRQYLVCRLLLEKKKNMQTTPYTATTRT